MRTQATYAPADTCTRCSGIALYTPLPLSLSRLSMHEPGASAAPRIICSLWVTGPPSRAAVLFKALISFAGLPLAGQARGARLNRLQAQARQQGRGCGCGYVSEVLVGVDPG